MVRSITEKLEIKQEGKRCGRDKYYPTANTTMKLRKTTEGLKQSGVVLSGRLGMSIAIVYKCKKQEYLGYRSSGLYEGRRMLSHWRSE